MVTTSAIKQALSWGVRRSALELRAASAAVEAKISDALPPVGLNLGGGNWRAFRWINFDERHMQKEALNGRLSETTSFPFASESLNYVFSSHFFEHVDDATAQRLFNESFRVLRRGGVFRIVVPDFDLAIQKYREGDHRFFDEGSWGMAPRYANWQAHGVEPTLENKLSYAFFSYSNMSDQGSWPPWTENPAYFCGPIGMDAARMHAKIDGQNVAEISRRFRESGPSKFHDLGHINAYDLSKFERMLRASGFSRVEKSSFRSSRRAELRKAAFDTRPDISLFIEAEKENAQ